jgi:hypothetical protein
MLLTANTKQAITLNAKNIFGWKSKRKIVVFSVDDYGNVRVDSSKARQALDNAGLQAYNRFDIYDTLETKEDLSMLYEVLTSVKDRNGNHAIFSSFALPTNIDFEKIIDNRFEQFFNEDLPATLNKLNGYEGVMDLLREGIKEKILVPHFHGREHLNLKVFNEKMKRRDHDLMTCLSNRSFTSISSPYRTISPTAAYEFDDFGENEMLKGILIDGLNAFERVYGFRADYFIAPGGNENRVLHQTLSEHGVKYIDQPLIKNEHQGNGKYKKSLWFTGNRSDGLTVLVRNCVFEPTEEKNIDWVSFCLKQIEAAFRWNRPAIISSHRVNFCGLVDPNHRLLGLSQLKALLQQITRRWPEVEFMSASTLGALITGNARQE